MTTYNSQPYSKFWVIIFILLTFGVGILLGIKLQTQKMVAMVQPSKIEEVLRYTEAWYVDEIDRAQLLEKALERLAKDTTTFSKKVTSPELQNIKQIIDKNYEGSGIDATILGDSLLLLKPTQMGDDYIYKPY